MTRAILKTIVFSLVILATCAAINWVLVPNDPDAYQAAKLDKLYNLRTTASPKIILVGGSNLAFGVDSKLLENDFGMPVVNMGLAKSVGLEYLLEETKPYIQADDIVVLAFEYEMFFDMYYGSDGLIVELQYVPEGFSHLNSLGQWETFVSKFGPIMQAKFAGYLRKGSSARTDEVYRRSGFNHYGDLTTHLDLPPAYEKNEIFSEDDEFRDESIEVLNEFYLEVLRRGARAVVSAPPLVNIEYEAHRERIEGLYQRLRDDITIPIISEPADYTFHPMEMYDTAYHLLRESRRIRTHRLLNDLHVTEGIGSGGVRGEQI